MDSLPYEIVLELFNFLEIYEVFSILTTCRGWVSIIRMDYFWKKRLDFDFGIVDNSGFESPRNRYMSVYHRISGYYGRSQRMKRRGNNKTRVRKFKWGYFETLVECKVNKAINPASRKIIRDGRFDFFSIDPNKRYEKYICEVVDYLVLKSGFSFYFTYLPNLKRFVESASLSQPKLILKIVENVKNKNFMVYTFRSQFSQFSFIFRMDPSIFPCFIDKIIQSEFELFDFYDCYRKLDIDLKTFVPDEEVHQDCSNKIIECIKSNKKYFSTDNFLSCRDFHDSSDEARVRLFLHLVQRQKLFRKCFNGERFVEIVREYLVTTKNPELKGQIFSIITKSRSYLERLIRTNDIKLDMVETKSESYERLFFTGKLWRFFGLSSNDERRKEFVEALFGGDDERPQVIHSNVHELFNHIPYRKIFETIPDKNLRKNISRYYLRTENPDEYNQYFPRLRDLFQICEQFPELLEEIGDHINFRTSEDGISAIVKNVKDLTSLQKFGSEFAEEILKKLLKKPGDFVKVVKNYSSLVMVFQSFPDYHDEIFTGILKKSKYEKKLSRRGIKIFRKNYRKEFNRFRN